ncbi:hypothetical protein MMC29_008431 [Sticta canariensis]|nr:hypothetical protein [Sticta canariensis]
MGERHPTTPAPPARATSKLDGPCAVDCDEDEDHQALCSQATTTSRQNATGNEYTLEKKRPVGVGAGGHVQVDHVPSDGDDLLQTSATATPRFSRRAHAASSRHRPYTAELADITQRRSLGGGGVSGEGADSLESSRSRCPAPCTHAQQPATTTTTSDRIAIFSKPAVSSRAYDVLKTLLSYFLLVYIFVGLVIVSGNLLFGSVYSALSPICRIPASELLSLPMCDLETSAQHQLKERPLVQFDRLMNVQSKFETVLNKSAGAVSLPLDMERSEESIRDLRTVVGSSDSPSKDELVLAFDGFVEKSEIASSDLRKFNRHVGHSADNILVTARWTKRILEHIVLRNAPKGGIVSFLNDKLLAPFQSLNFTEDTLCAQYVQYSRIVEHEIHRLMVEAQALLDLFKNIQDCLDAIHRIAVRGDPLAQGSQAEVLSQLWKKLGGNRVHLEKFNLEPWILGQINTYRQSAIAHVGGALIMFQRMDAELQELRKTVGGRGSLGGSRGVPLSVYIEILEIGVKSLEKCRNQARVVHDKELRKRLRLDRGYGGYKEIEEIKGAMSGKKSLVL